MILNHIAQHTLGLPRSYLVDRSLVRLLLVRGGCGHLPSLAGPKVTTVACSVPPPSLVPRAVMHLPCAMACEVAEAPFVYCVLSVTVTSV